MQIKIPIQLGECRPGAFLVGGSVRDLILGMTPLDYDIAVASDPAGFAHEIALKINGRVVLLGREGFTVLRVVSNNGCLDITSYEGRDIRQDLLDRDFTINALACDLKDGSILDITGGLNDLRNGLVRMVSDTIFQKDPARLVRAFRMAAMPRFKIEPKTRRVIGMHANLTSAIAGERIWSELIRILDNPEASPILAAMADTHVLRHIIPGLLQNDNITQFQCVEFNKFNHSLKSIQVLERLLQSPGDFFLPEPACFIESLDRRLPALLKFSLLIHDLGHPACHDHNAQRRAQFRAYAADYADLAQRIGRRLRMSNRQREWIANLVGQSELALSAYRAHQSQGVQNIEAVGRFFMRCGALSPYLIILALADHLSEGESDAPNDRGLIEFLKGALAIYLEKRLHVGLPPIITGHDLMRGFKLKPSPQIGALLRRVRELQLAGVITHKEAAMQWVTDNLASLQTTNR